MKTVTDEYLGLSVCKLFLHFPEFRRQCLLHESMNIEYKMETRTFSCLSWDTLVSLLWLTASSWHCSVYRFEFRISVSAPGEWKASLRVNHLSWQSQKRLQSILSQHALIQLSLDLNAPFEPSRLIWTACQVSLRAVPQIPVIQKSVTCFRFLLHCHTSRARHFPLSDSEFSFSLSREALSFFISVSFCFYYLRQCEPQTTAKGDIVPPPFSFQSFGHQVPLPYFPPKIICWMTLARRISTFISLTFPGALLPVSHRR